MPEIAWRDSVIVVVAAAAVGVAVVGIAVVAAGIAVEIAVVVAWMLRTVLPLPVAVVPIVAADEQRTVGRWMVGDV